MFKMQIEVDQVWESRIARSNGTRERVRIVKLDGRSARVRSENPLPGRPEERTVWIGMNGSHIMLAGMKLVQRADGTPFVAGKG